MSTKDNIEFKNAIRDISHYVYKLDSPFDRVRCTEWVRKLIGLPDDDLEAAKIRNEYAQMLRIQVCNGFLHIPFITKPPLHNLIPIAERLGDIISKQIPDLPKAGPITPILHQKSSDGRAYVCAKQIPGGVLCYLAVSPDGLN